MAIQLRPPADPEIYSIKYSGNQANPNYPPHRLRVTLAPPDDVSALDAWKYSGTVEQWVNQHRSAIVPSVLSNLHPTCSQVIQRLACERWEVLNLDALFSLETSNPGSGMLNYTYAKAPAITNDGWQFQLQPSLYSWFDRSLWRFPINQRFIGNCYLHRFLQEDNQVILHLRKEGHTLTEAEVRRWATAALQQEVQQVTIETYATFRQGKAIYNYRVDIGVTGTVQVTPVARPSVPLTTIKARPQLPVVSSVNSLKRPQRFNPSQN